MNPCTLTNPSSSCPRSFLNVLAMITDLKSANMLLFFKMSANRYGIGLSNELTFIIIAQGAAKL